MKIGIAAHRLVLGLTVSLSLFCCGAFKTAHAQDEGSKGLIPAAAGIQVSPKIKTSGKRTYQTQKQFVRRPAPVGTQYKQVGITIWRVSAEGGKGVEQVGEEGQSLERLDTNAPYKNGDTIRLSVVSPNGGYLYVVDQEKYSDGTFGPAMLVFPTLRTRNGNNLIQAWETVDIPGKPSVWQFTPLEPAAGQTPKTQVAEVLTLIISPRPLVNRSRITRQQLPLTKVEFEGWQKQWGKEGQQFDMEGSVGQVIKPSPKDRAKGIEQKGEEADDLGAQTVYQVAAKPGSAMMVTVPLRFSSSGN